MLRRALNVTLLSARRIVISVVGFTIVGLGILMIVLPGPAILVIPVGLAILGLEFAWARRWLGHVRSGSKDALQRWGDAWRRRTGRDHQPIRDPLLERF